MRNGRRYATGSLVQRAVTTTIVIDATFSPIPMRVVIAADSFKGSLSAPDVCAALAAASRAMARRRNHRCADGRWRRRHAGRDPAASATRRADAVGVARRRRRAIDAAYGLSTRDGPPRSSKWRRSSALPIAPAWEHVGARTTRGRRRTHAALLDRTAPLHDRAGRQQHQRRRRRPSRGARARPSTTPGANVAPAPDGLAALAYVDASALDPRLASARSPSCRTSTIRLAEKVARLRSSGRRKACGVHRGLRRIDRPIRRARRGALGRKAAESRARARPADWASRCSCRRHVPVRRRGRGRTDRSRRSARGRRLGDHRRRAQRPPRRCCARRRLSWPSMPAPGVPVTLISGAIDSAALADLATILRAVSGCRTVP